MTCAFDRKKHKILSALDVSHDEYVDVSPKGSIDEGIRELINEINAVPGFVTTSSCAGRISVFLEGSKKVKANVDSSGPKTEQGPTGKGGGKWLFVSHDPVDIRKMVEVKGSLFSALNIIRNEEIGSINMPEASRLVHFKFEPMEANAVVSAAIQAGFRESGALGLTTAKDGTTCPMVAVRSAGISFDSIIGFQAQDEQVVSLVDAFYLEVLLRLGNERFRVNTERIDRFRSLLKGRNESKEHV